MCTMVVFLMGIPKNGFGFEDSVGFGLGDWLAADGPLVVAGETLCGQTYQEIRKADVNGRERTGVKTIACGLGLNEGAVTFNLFTAAEALSVGGVFETLPLNGGMAWMNRFDRLAGASDLTGGFMLAD